MRRNVRIPCILFFISSPSISQFVILPCRSCIIINRLRRLYVYFMQRRRWKIKCMYVIKCKSSDVIFACSNKFNVALNPFLVRVDTASKVKVTSTFIVINEKYSGGQLSGILIIANVYASSHYSNFCINVVTLPENRIIQIKISE